MKTLLDKEYYAESIIDAAEDMHWALETEENPDVDENGLHKGTFRLTLTYTPSVE